MKFFRYSVVAVAFWLFLYASLQWFVYGEMVVSYGVLVVGCLIMSGKGALNNPYWIDLKEKVSEHRRG